MNLITVLVMTYFLNGSIQNASLLTTSPESCIQDMTIASTMVESLGGAVVSVSCITRKAQ